MKITFNSPVILMFTLICVVIQFFSSFLGDNFLYFFSVGGSMNLLNPIDYFRLVSHSMGHSGWAHLSGNFMLILAIGPILEEKYGSRKLLLMFFITALATGIMNVIFKSTGLAGASGIVFMLILLGSITNIKKKEIPLTFILIFFLYIGTEILHTFDVSYQNISQFGHIIGGVFGAFFGFIAIDNTSSESETINEDLNI